MTFFNSHTIDVVVTALPFLLYSVLLGKLAWSWGRVRRIADRRKEGRLAAIIAIIALCTLTFMVANAYAIHIWGKTFLSFKVFQMFVLGNCLAYWLVLDLVAGEAESETP